MKKTQYIVQRQGFEGARLRHIESEGLWDAFKGIRSKCEFETVLGYATEYIYSDWDTCLFFYECLEELPLSISYMDYYNIGLDDFENRYNLLRGFRVNERYHNGFSFTYLYGYDGHFDFREYPKYGWLHLEEGHLIDDELSLKCKYNPRDLRNKEKGWQKIASDFERGWLDFSCEIPLLPLIRLVAGMSAGNSIKRGGRIEPYFQSDGEAIDIVDQALKFGYIKIEK